MAIEIVECQEFSEISIRLSSLMRNGEIQIDPRIAAKGYLSTAFRRGQVVLRTTKFVGLIPLTPEISVRVVPRAPISNLSYMLARSQKAPTAIAGFARGYNSRFVRADNVERLFGQTLADQCAALCVRGLIKRYERPEMKIPWRGRFLAAETVRRHASRGVRYRHEFDQSVLTDRTIDNFALKEALGLVLNWYQRNERGSPVLLHTRRALAAFENIPSWRFSHEELLRKLGILLSAQSNIRPDYAEALWSAYAVLDGAIPDLNSRGSLRLDSLIVDVSEIFEAYLRRELSMRLANDGYRVFDGWKRPHPFFADGGAYSVHPDMIIERDGSPVAVLDAKYKPDVSEQDRYEVLSFMDVLGVQIGGFVCPVADAEESRVMGTTSSGKRLSNLRVDLAAEDTQAEIDRFAENVRRMIAERHEFV